MTQFDRKLTPAEFKFVEHKLYNYLTNNEIVEELSLIDTFEPTSLN